MFISVAPAERAEFEGVSCFSHTHTPLQFSPTGEIYVGSFEGKGIFRSTSKPYYENTFKSMGVLMGQMGKFTWNGYTKIMHVDGDVVMWDFSGDSVNGSIGKIIYGTGKYKGAKGEQTTKNITKTKPVVQGTEQTCQQVIGWVELAK